VFERAEEEEEKGRRVEMRKGMAVTLEVACDYLTSCLHDKDQQWFMVSTFHPRHI